MESTEHIGLGTNTTERELAARRPAEITQVSLTWFFFFFFCFHNSKVAKTKQPQDCISDRRTRVNTRDKPIIDQTKPLHILKYFCLDLSLSPCPTLNRFMKVGETKKQKTKRDFRCQTTPTELGSRGSDGDNCVCWMIKMVSENNSCLCGFPMIRKPSVLMAFFSLCKLVTSLKKKKNCSQMNGTLLKGGIIAQNSKTKKEKNKTKQGDTWRHTVSIQSSALQKLVYLQLILPDQMWAVEMYTS